MRIGIICYPSIGGSGLVATELGMSLARRGHEVHFVSYSVPFRLSQFEPNVHFHAVDPVNYPLFNQTLYTFSLTAKIAEVVQAYDLDVIHAHYSIPHSLCAHLAREVSGRAFKIVTTLHGTDVTIVGQDKPLYQLNRYGIEKSDLVTTVSKFQQAHTHQYFQIERGIKVIYNFVDAAVFRPVRDKQAHFRQNDEHIIMHVSNFREPKNPRGIVETFYRVQQQLDARLVLVGDGPAICEIRNHCQTLGLDERVCFVGKVDHVETVIPLADCMLQPSYQEAFGMVSLEAMACEVPVVCSNVDGMPEVVVHDETGYLAAPDDHDGMANYIAQICRDPALAQRLGQTGRQRATKHFHPDNIVEQYLRCYEQVLNATTLSKGDDTTKKALK